MAQDHSATGWLPSLTMRRLACTIILLSALGACGGDDGALPDTEDAVTDDQLTEGELGAIPIDGDPASPATTAASPTTRAADTAADAESTATTTPPPSTVATSAPTSAAPPPTAAVTTSVPPWLPVEPDPPTTRPAATVVPAQDEAPLNELGVPIVLDEAGSLACAGAGFARDGIERGDVGWAGDMLNEAAGRAAASSVEAISSRSEDLSAALAAPRPADVLNEFLSVCEGLGHQI